MEHCTNNVYHGDKFCSDCGDELQQKPQRFNIGELSSDILEQVRKYYPDARAVTGRVLQSDLYKRVTKSSSCHLVYSYWWVKLEASDGQIIETSISAESKYTQSISRGHILTLYYPTSLQLLYPIKDRDAKKMVKDNQGAPCVVMHDDDGQSYSVENLYPEPIKKNAWLWIVAAIATAFAASQVMITIESIALVSIIISVIALAFEIKRNNRKFTYAVLKYEALQASFKQMLDVTKYDLGYFNIERNRDNSDIICIQCNSRLPHDLNYCVHCGERNAPQENLLLEEGGKYGIVSSEENMPSVYVGQRETFSVAKIRACLADLYLFTSQNQYTHKHVFCGDRVATVSNEFILAQIKSTEVSNNVNDKTIVTTTTTETKHYRGNSYQYSTYNDQTSSFRNRSSTLNGKVIIEYVSGETRVLHLREEILGTLDVGDWIAIAYCSTKFAEGNRYNLEYFYNITKSKGFNNQTFLNYSDNRGALVLKGLNILFVIAGVTSMVFKIDLGIMMSVGLFGVLNVYAIFAALVNSSTNSTQRKAIFKPLQAKIKEFKHSIDKLKNQLDVL